MKIVSIKKGLTAGLLLSAAFPVAAQYSVSGTPDDPNNPLRKLVQYVQNLGLYLGYQLQNQPTEAPSSTLLFAASTQVMQTYAINTLMGSIPVNAISSAYSQFVPNISSASVLNAWANSAFNQGGGAGAPLYIIPQIDQQTYQQDPVSQSILNILGTPDASSCINVNPSDQTQAYSQNCKLNYENKVSVNVVGEIPDVQSFFSYQYVATFLPQLNSNTFLSPLWYSTDQATAESTSSTAATTTTDSGLTADNQLKAATNFIQYVSGAVAPASLAKQSTYTDLYTLAKGLTKGETPFQQQQANETLATYLASLRTYASQMSVGMSNLYYIFGKRLPQKQGTTADAPQMSQALSEYNMATWRLSQSQTQGQEAWLDKINKASSATVQKEIAILLAEINYQMYLNRQQDERLLLTQSVLLLQTIKQTIPDLQSAAQTSSGNTDSN